MSQHLVICRYVETRGVLWGLILSFHYVNPQNGTQVIGLRGKSYLAFLFAFITVIFFYTDVV